MQYALTLGDLKASGYQTRSVKDELRTNLIKKLRNGERLLPGILGYDKTVVQQIINAILSKHNFILLGLGARQKPHHPAVDRPARRKDADHCRF